MEKAIYQEKINFHQERDFSETFNVSVKFVRQNFKIYFRCILFLAGPFVLLHSFAGAYYQSVLLTKTALIKSGQLYSMNKFGWEYFLSLFLQFISILSLMCTNFSFMIVYQEKGVGNITVGDVAKKMLEHTGKIIGGFFLYLLLIIIFGVAIAVVIGLMIGGGSPAAGIIFLLLFVVGFLMMGPNFLWQLSTSYLVMISENEIPFSAFGRTRIVMKRNYWWTWLVSVCVTIVIFFLSVMFAIPLGIVTFIRTYSIATGGSDDQSVLYLCIFIFSTFFSTLVYALLYVVCGFHYFSLAEKIDGAGLMERINEIGNREKEIGITAL